MKKNREKSRSLSRKALSGTKVGSIFEAQKAQKLIILRTFQLKNVQTSAETPERCLSCSGNASNVPDLACLAICHMAPLFSNLGLLLIKAQFTSDLTSKFGYIALISILRFLISKMQFTSDTTCSDKLERFFDPTLPQ